MRHGFKNFDPAGKNLFIDFQPIAEGAKDCAGFGQAMIGALGLTLGKDDAISALEGICEADQRSISIVALLIFHQHAVDNGVVDIGCRHACKMLQPMNLQLRLIQIHIQRNSN